MICSKVNFSFHPHNPVRKWVKVNIIESFKNKFNPQRFARKVVHFYNFLALVDLWLTFGKKNQQCLNVHGGWDGNWNDWDTMNLSCFTDSRACHHFLWLLILSFISSGRYCYSKIKNNTSMSLKGHRATATWAMFINSAKFSFAIVIAKFIFSCNWKQSVLHFLFHFLSEFLKNSFFICLI